MSETNYGVNLVENGSFEDVSYSRGHGHRFGHDRFGGRHGNNAELSGWQTSSGPGPDIERGNPWTPAADGNRYIELDGSGGRNTNSSIFQDIPTGGAGTFELSFSYAAPPFSHASSNGIEVIWNGEVIDTITASGGWGTDWQTFTYELEGAGDVTRLEFRAVGRDDGRGGLLDDISVVGVEPPELFTDAAETVVLADDDPDYGSGEAYDAKGGDDVVVGGDLDDEIFGNAGNDTLSGGAGDDVLIGGSEEKTFIEVEQTVEHDLSGLTETPSLGIDPAHFQLQNDHAVTMTFVGEEAGYRNTVGIYKIADDGSIYDVEIVFQDASDSRWYGTETGTAVDLDLSSGDNFGVFIVADGASRNNFNRMDDGHFEFRNADGSQATVDSDEPELVYVNDWGWTKSVRGDVYHSAATSTNTQLNGDDDIHVQSSSNGDGGLRLQFEDLPSDWSDNDFDDVVIDLSFAPVTETVLVSDADADALYGEDGDDELYGGYGRDTLDGGTGNDILDGGKGRDDLSGGDGDDLLHGGGGKDKLSGGAGDDDLRGNGGDDTLRGNGGDDKLRGGNGEDLLKGGGGDDLLIGGAGADVIDGGNGDDTVRADLEDIVGDVTDGGFGTDTLKITVETDELQDPAILQDLLDLSAFIANNADANSKSGPSHTFAALGLTVSNFEDIDITVIDSVTGEVVPGGLLTPEIVVSVGDVSGDEDTAIALDISAAVTNSPDLFDLSVTISGLPAGAVLSAGTDNLDGSWTVDADDLAGLALTPPADSAADFSIDVTATATSISSGQETASEAVAGAVVVDAVADAPSLVVGDITLVDSNAGDQVIDGTEGKDTLQGYGGNDTINGGDKGDTIIGDGSPTGPLVAALSISALLADTDGSETLSVRIEGLPAGVTLSAGAEDGPGAVMLTQAELDDLTITVPNGTASFSLEVTAVATETDADSGQVSTAIESAIALATVDISVDGDDILNGGKGADYIEGNGGNDLIAGDGGADEIYGGAGNDVIDAGAGNDIVDGGAGADTISGGGGNDILLGGDGNDLIEGDAGDDVLKGGAGDDVLNGNGGQDLLEGEGGDDQLIGGAQNDTLYGGAGDDIISGEGGQDVIFGGDGEDEIHGGAGADTIDGGDQNDMIYGEDGDDVIDGGALDDQIWGGLGKDELLGGAGNDRLFGGEDNDSLTGNEGNDYLRGEDGNDVIFGSIGNDLLFGDDGKDELYGEEGDDILVGGGGADVLFGGEGNDLLWGEGGSDTLYGGAGDDRLEGHAGADLLIGGSEVDFMTGKGGNDRFQFDLSAIGESGIGAGNRDVITDFKADAEDTIEFSGVTSFSFVGDETQAFAGGATASGRFNDSLKVLEIDSDGDQVADLEIELQGVDGADLDDSDFSVI